jgi:hypothetical protein
MWNGDSLFVSLSCKASPSASPIRSFCNIRKDVDDREIQSTTVQDNQQQFQEFTRKAQIPRPNVGKCNKRRLQQTKTPKRNHPYYELSLEFELTMLVAAAIVSDGHLTRIWLETNNRPSIYFFVNKQHLYPAVSFGTVRKRSRLKRETFRRSRLQGLVNLASIDPICSIFFLVPSHLGGRPLSSRRPPSRWRVKCKSFHERGTI